MLKKTLFNIARSRYAGYFIGTAFEYLTPLMPLKAIYSDKSTIIFPHPVPFWETHFLAVPKKRIPSFASLNLESAATQTLMFNLFQVIQHTSATLGLSEFTILVNGGSYQDVPQIHFHLAQGVSKNGIRLGQEKFVPAKKNDTIISLDSVIAYANPTPLRPTHWLIATAKAAAPFIDLNLSEDEARQGVIDSLRLAQIVVEQQQLNAYTLLINNYTPPSDEPLTFHLVSG